MGRTGRSKGGGGRSGMPGLVSYTHGSQVSCSACASNAPLEHRYLSCLMPLLLLRVCAPADPISCHPLPTPALSLSTQTTATSHHTTPHTQTHDAPHLADRGARRRARAPGLASSLVAQYGAAAGGDPVQPGGHRGGHRRGRGAEVVCKGGRPCRRVRQPVRGPE